MVHVEFPLYHGRAVVEGRCQTYINVQAQYCSEVAFAHVGNHANVLVRKLLLVLI